MVLMYTSLITDDFEQVFLYLITEVSFSQLSVLILCYIKIKGFYAVNDSNLLIDIIYNF